MGFSPLGASHRTLNFGIQRIHDEHEAVRTSPFASDGYHDDGEIFSDV